CCGIIRYQKGRSGRIGLSHENAFCHSTREWMRIKRTNLRRQTGIHKLFIRIDLGPCPLSSPPDLLANSRGRIKATYLLWQETNFPASRVFNNVSVKDDAIMVDFAFHDAIFG